MTEQRNTTENMHDAAFTFATLDINAVKHSKVTSKGELTHIDWNGMAATIEGTFRDNKEDAKQKVEGVVRVLRRFNDDNAVKPITLDGLSVMRDLSVTLLYGEHLTRAGTLKEGTDHNVLEQLAQRRGKTVSEVKDEVGQARIFLTLTAGAMQQRQEQPSSAPILKMIASAAR